jgi:uncharacterized protein (DUF2147 family)
VTRPAVAVTLGLFAAAPLSVAAAPVGSPLGDWFDQSKKAVIHVTHCAPSAQALCGRITWLREPNLPDGRPKRDANNTDPALRNRPICGLPMLGGFVPGNEAGVWKDGRIYNPENGKTYHATLRVEPDGTMRVRGYVMITLFGESQVWTRPPEPLPACTPPR